MKICFCLWFVLLLAMPLYAETYSWVDESGTHNYTEDYSRVPKKFQKKVKRSEDLQQNAPPLVSPEHKGATGQADKTGAKSAPVPGDEKVLYGGKSRDTWRKELDVLEAELSGIEQHMEQVRKQLFDPNGVSKVQFEVLKKEYDDNRVIYVQKYKSYTELIETVRKAGIVVEMKK